MMKNEYNAPKMELTVISVSDIITTSGGFPGLDDGFSTPSAPSSVGDLDLGI